MMTAAIRVLYVDDESPLLEVGKSYLERTNDFTVTTASSAPAALKLLKSNGIQAIVSDYQMPGMDGIEFLKAVRAINPHLPFILLTDKGREEVVIEAFTNGMDFYLQKGAKPEILFSGLADTIKKAVKIETARKEFYHSEARYRGLFETSPDGILIVDADSGVITDTNPLLLTLLGYTREEILGKNIWDIGVIREKSLAEQAAADLKKTGYLRYDNLPVKTKDGRDIAVELVSNAYDVETQKVIQYNIRDITERRRAEEEHGRLAAIVESSDAAIIGKTLDGTITSWNTGAERIYGYPVQEIIGKSISLLVPPDNPDDTRTILDQIRNGEPVIRYETLRRKKDGGKINVTLIVSPIKDAHGRCIGVSTIAHDITGRKRGEDALRETKDYLENLIRYANVPIISWNPELKITEFNRAFEQLNGMTREEVIGQPLAILFTDKTREKSMDLIRRAICGEHWEVVEIPICHVSGETRIVLWNSANILDPTGTVIATIAQGQDITERKAAEEAMKTFSEDLDRKVLERTSNLDDVNLNLMTEIGIRLNAEKHLSKNLKEKEVLLKEVHHRVKNNLQIIISLLNLQSRYITDETTRSAFKESQNRVRAMAMVHEKLYQSNDLAKLDLGNYLKFLGDQLFQFLGMKGKGITLTIDVHDISLAIDTAIPLGLMINELISNSLKYAFPEGRKGEISLAIHQQGHTFTILYKDNGVGIPEGFDWRNAQSMGLRLVITLVEQLDGTIELDRSSGTAFTIVVKEKE